MFKPVALILAIGAASVLTTANAAEARGGREAPASFAELDTNKDGQVTKDEMRAQAKARFDSADTNNDGSLSKDEMIARAKEGRAEKAGRHADRMLRHMDANENGTLEFDELRTEEHLDRMFSRLDKDANGTLSEDEMKKMRKGGKNGKKDRKSD